MPSTSIKKNINCPKKDLINIVLDIEKYPEFVPWCTDSKIYESKIKENIIEITAELTIGKGFIKDKYKSFVIYNKILDTIDVTNIGGPLKHLTNKWNFRETDNSTQVDFHVNFELKNSLLNVLMSKWFDIGAKRIADAFLKRVNEISKQTTESTNSR
jgi:coenzyme Q-binding protein COQ10